jgi:ketosteroid isomerase-like protein
MSKQTIALDGVVAELFAAINEFDTDAIMGTFAEDALVNDVRREFWGKDAIRPWVEREIVGDKVTIEVADVIQHDGLTIVQGMYDGEYDKTGVPDPLILTHYMTVAEDSGKIGNLIIINNQPVE